MHYDLSPALTARIAPNSAPKRSPLTAAALWLSGVAAVILLIAAIVIGSIAAIALVAGIARAEPARALTNEKALNLLVALRGLESHTVIIKQGGADVQVQQPWDFGSALLRLRIKRNIQQLEPIEKAIKDTREAMITEALAKLPANPDGKQPTMIVPGTPEFDAFLKQLSDVLAKPVDGQVDLGRIRASELKLDKNDIGSSTLLGLDPILDDDVTPK